jgi:hypothetical protein
MVPNQDWLERLGPSDFSVTPDWSFGPPGAHRLHYWLCAEVPQSCRDLARRVQELVDSDNPGDIDQSAFTSFARQLDEIARQRGSCMAVYDTIHDTWHPMESCVFHAAKRS